MAIETKVITIDGVDYYVNESTDGKIIEGGYPFGLYEDAIDPISEDRKFVETDKYFPNEEFPVWEENTSYKKGGKVTYDYYRYESIIDDNMSTPGEPVKRSSSWVKIVNKGE